MFEIGTQLPLFLYPRDLVNNGNTKDWASVDCCGMDWDGLMESKYEHCTDHFIDSCRYDGIQAPACIQFSDGRVYFGNGHHRFAVALNHDLVLPVVFDYRDHMIAHITESANHPDHDAAQFYYDDAEFDEDYDSTASDLLRWSFAS